MRSMDLVKFLKTKAEKYRDKPFLLGEHCSISYRAFDEITDRMAYGLERLGVSRGEHVAVLHPNSIQTLLSYFSIIKAGGIVIPINTVYTPREIRFILNNSGANTLILHENYSPIITEIRNQIPLVKNILVRKNHEAIEATIENIVGSPLSIIKEKSFNPDDAAIMFYTSGTTGNPKGVILTHRNFCFSGPNIAQNYGLLENDVTIAVLPLVHVFCVASPFFGSLSSGGSVVVLDRF